MKTGMELLKELKRARDAEEFSSSARAAYTVCIERLQVWLREVDGWLDHRKDEEWLFDARMIRRYLLGTTREEKG